MPHRPRVLHFDVTVDRTGDARSALGGSALPREVEWWAEHLVLAGLVRCTLKSFRYHARRAGHEPVTRGSGTGVVTRRELVTLIFELAGRSLPDWSQSEYPGYPLVTEGGRRTAALAASYFILPALILTIGIALTRPRRRTK